MPRDLHQLLHDTAVEPAGTPDVGQFVRRGRRRRRVRHATSALGAAAAMVAVVAIGASLVTGPPSPQIAGEPPSSPTPSASEPTQGPNGADTLALKPVECDPNRCMPTFELNGVVYQTTMKCDRVAPEAIGQVIDVMVLDGDTAGAPSTVYTLDGHPVSAGVAADLPCNQRALALPTERPDNRDSALGRARLICDVLAEPRPQDRCGLGGDAQWRAGDAWYDNAFAPFPEAVDAADLVIEAGGPAPAWRTDPLEVATRRFADEGVCKDEQDTPCPWDVTLTQDDEARAVVEGTVNPFPHVTWDIRIEVERLGEYSWWTTRMTIEPRPAE